MDVREGYIRRVARVRRWREPIGLVVLSIAVLVTQAYRYGFPISTGGPIGTWRRTQTAWGIRSMMRGSLNPLQAEVPVLGPPWRLPFEFPLYQWVSAVVGRLTGLTDVVAGRMVASVALIVTGIFTYVLGKELVAPAVGAVAAVVVTLSPYGIHWGAEISIEYFTVALCLATFLVGRRWIVDGMRRSMAWFLLLGSAASLSKTTSLIPWLLGLALLVVLSWRTSDRRTSLMRLVVVGAPLAPGLLWTRWADAVKADNPHAAPFVTSELVSHNFGRLADRAEMATWQFMFRNIFDTTVGGTLVALALIIVAASRLDVRRHVAILGVIVLAGPAIFASLYWAHPYYAIAVMPALAVLFATGIATSVHLLFADSSPAAKAGALVAALCGLLLLAATTPEGVELMNATLLRNRGGSVAYDDIEAFTSPSDALLVVSSAGWDPTLSFVADRRVLMMSPPSDPDATRPAESELGSIYRFVYWMGDVPDDVKWSDYLPPSVSLEPISSNLFRIVASSVG